MGKASRPLAAKRVVITRAREQSQELVDALESLGAEAIVLPCVAFAAAEEPAALDAALLRLSEFDWILFTSQNAVRFFAQRCRELGLPDRPIDSLQMYRPQVAAVGPATALAANQEGIRVDYVAKKNTGESLVGELGASLKDREILLPQSDRAAARLAIALRDVDAHVTPVTAYRTLKPETFDAAILDRIRCAEVDAIVFASPSAFSHLSDAIGAGELAALSSRVQFAAIGPTTAKVMREAAVRVAVEADESSADGMADALAEFYERQPLRARPV